MNGKVDFFIVGQPKSGTTALASFLAEHPDICVTVPKEPCYMARDLIAESDAFHGNKRHFHVRTPQQYAATFAHAGAHQLVGDASTPYLFSKAAAFAIREHNPGAKVVMMLRNPIDMLDSLYRQYVNQAMEDAGTFREALAREAGRASWHDVPRGAHTPSYLLYRERGKYCEQVSRYFEAFDRAHILTIVSDDFRSDNAGVYAQVLRFLGVDEGFKPNFRPVHERKAARSAPFLKLAHTQWLKQSARALLGEQAYTRLQKRVLEPLLLKKAPTEEVDPDLRRELEDYFEDDVMRLSTLLGRDLRALWFGRRS